MQIITTANLQRHRRGIYLLTLVLALLAMSGLMRLVNEANYKVYFNADDPLLALEASVNQHFALAESAVLILEAGEQSLIAAQSLQSYARFEQQLLALPFVTEVRGFYQFVDLADAGDDLFADVECQGPGSEENCAWQELLQHPRGRDLVTADHRFGLMEVSVALPEGDSARQVQLAMTSIRELATDNLLATGAVKDLGYSGVLALNQAYIDVVRHDLRLFVPGLLVLMALVLYAALRNWKLVLLPLLSGVLAALMAMGIAGWAGWALAAINAFTPIIIISLHLAAAMHVIVNFMRQRSQGLSPDAAMDASLSFNLKAMSLSALTTAAGFLLLALSPSPPVRVVGYCVAIGVAISFAFNILLLPLLLPRLKLSPSRAGGIAASLNMAPLFAWLASHRRGVLLTAAVLSGLALLSLGRAQINDSVYNYFPQQHGFSRGIQQLDQNFAGCVRLSYTLAADDPGAVLSEDYRQTQRAFVLWLQQQPEVGGSNEIYTLIERRGIDLEKAAGVLQQRSVNDIGIEGLVTADLSATRIEVMLPALTSKDLIAFDQRARQWLAANAGGLDYRGGIGPDLIFAHLGQRNAYSMFVSLAIALGGIGLLVGLLFRSAGLAGLGLLCNLLPLVLIYALWFSVGGYISLGAAVVLGMIMGVIVDDTLHILCKFRSLLAQGVTDPVQELGCQVLPAVIITSVTLVAGLLIGALSDFRPLRELSLLSAAVITAALLVDAVLLPAILMRTGQRAI